MKQPLRFTHYLGKNQCTEPPQRILFVDTEAKIENLPDGRIKQTLRLGTAIYLRRKESNYLRPQEFEFYTIEEFYDIIDSLSREKTKLYIFAHNMNYDYTILKMDSYLSSRGYEIELRTISTAFIINAKKEGHTIVLLSSTNYYRMSLEKLGEIFGYPKMKVDFETADDETLMQYCMNDTRVLAHLMKNHFNFIVENDLGNFRSTIASQALTCYRHKFLKANSLLIHTFEEIIKLELESYRGGRSEAFRLGKIENVYKLDVNSMYPFVMKEKEYPTKPLSKTPIKGFKVEDLEFALKNGFVLANCNLTLYEPAIACKRDKLLFPIGKIVQTITSPEIQYILEHPETGKINRINLVVGYEKEKLFSGYVDFFYNLRLANKDNPAINTMAKIFLNSLYGKFAQKGYSTDEKVKDENEISRIKAIMDIEESFAIDDVDLEGNDRKYTRLGDDIYETIPPIERLSKNSIPIISSAVTSYSRMYLWKLIELAGQENVFYCDTDSLFTNELGFTSIKDAGLISNNELGKLKLEETGTAEIYGVKNYKFNQELKLKGIKKNAQLISRNKYLQYQFLTKASKYRKGIEDGTVMLEPVEKTISDEYTKGKYINGKIFPLRLSEW